MSERDLLELAAQAAGLRLVPYTWDKGAPWGEHEGFTIEGQGPDEWNQLTNDGDALRLAVRLGMDLRIILQANFSMLVSNETCVGVDKPMWVGREPHRDDQYAATRRAITRAAAEIGRAMP